MKSITIFCIAFNFLIILKTSAQDIHCRALDKAVIIDGDPSDWPQPFRYYDGVTKLQFSMANDSSNFYICLKMTDEQYMIKIFSAGLNIWIDPKGKRKEGMGLSFPVKTERPVNEAETKRHKQSEDRDPGVQRSDLNRLKTHAMLQQTTLCVKGFTGIPDQILPLKNTYGIQVAFGWDSLNILTIEYKIPLIMVLGHQPTAADTLKHIGIGFIENAMDVPKNKGGEGSENEASSGGMGGNGGMGNGSGGSNMGGMSGRGGMGGRGGGMSHGSMQDVNPMTQEQKLWLKVFLSYNSR